ncbi:nucleotide-binding alpha-beta plait domain-containing protein [Tanacetum coccineum]
MGRQAGYVKQTSSLNQEDNDGDWIKVSRSRKGYNKQEKDVGRKSFATNNEGSNRLTDFDKVMKEKAKSFFFTNFPKSWDFGALWKMFSRYGSVVDVYIAFKRTKKGMRFNFMRFKNIVDTMALERRIKGILIDDFKLIINHAKVIKLGGVVVLISDFPPMKTGAQHMPRRVIRNFNRSFKEAVVGPSSKSQPSVLNVPIEEDSYLRRRLEKCWVGKAKNIQVLQNAWDIMKNNGLVDFQVKYIGGLSLLFELDFKDAACESLKSNKIWLMQWFDDLNLWEENSDPSGRLIWLNIEGLPILARNIGAVKSVAKNFGRNLEIGRLDFDSRSLLPVTEDQFHASIFLPSGSDHPKHDDELSSFEEEFMRPTMADASFLSPRKSYRVVDAENFENDCNNDKSSFNPSPLSSTRIPLPLPYELYPTQSSPIMDNVKPTPDFVYQDPNSVDDIQDLNIPHMPNEGINQDDVELDELLSIFQRISNSTDMDHHLGGKKKKHKYKKKKKLIVGGGSPSQEVLLEVVDDDMDMKNIGAHIGFSFKPKDPRDASASS